MPSRYRHRGVADLEARRQSQDSDSFDDVEHGVRLCALGVVTLGPVVTAPVWPNTKLSGRKIWPKGPERRSPWCRARDPSARRGARSGLCAGTGRRKGQGRREKRWLGAQFAPNGDIPRLDGDREDREHVPPDASL